MTGVTVPVYESSKSPGGTRVDQHFFVVEPSPDGTMQVSEGYLLKNDGKTTWNDPDRGTLQFELSRNAARGKVEVNVVAPGGLPIRRAPDALGKPNQYKLDFPIKPGESRVDFSWNMPFRSPGDFEDHGSSRAPTNWKWSRLPESRSKARTSLSSARSPPPNPTSMASKVPTSRSRSKAPVCSTPGRIRVRVVVAAMAVEISARTFPSSTVCCRRTRPSTDSVLAVKWVLLTMLGMLALGFVLLYRKGDPTQAIDLTASTGSEPETATKASRHARGRG